MHAALEMIRYVMVFDFNGYGLSICGYFSSNNGFVLHLYCDNIVASKQATTSTGIGGALGSAATVLAATTNHYKEHYSTQGSSSQDHTLHQLKRDRKLVK